MFTPSTTWCAGSTDKSSAPSSGGNIDPKYTAPCHRQMAGGCRTGSHRPRAVLARATTTHPDRSIVGQRPWVRKLSPCCRGKKEPSDVHANHRTSAAVLSAWPPQKRVFRQVDQTGPETGTLARYSDSPIPADRGCENLVLRPSSRLGRLVRQALRPVHSAIKKSPVDRVLESFRFAHQTTHRPVAKHPT